MKDSIITARRKKTELITLLACFVIANVVNLCAIIAYGTQFKELFTQLGYIALFSLALYALWSVIRIIFYLIKRLFNSKKQKQS